MAALENNLIPQKIKYRVTVRLSNSTSSYIVKRTETEYSYKDLYMHVLAALFTIAKRLKRPKFSSVGECVNMWYSHTMEWCALE